MEHLISASSWYSRKCRMHQGLFWTPQREEFYWSQQFSFTSTVCMWLREQHCLCLQQPLFQTGLQLLFQCTVSHNGNLVHSHYSCMGLGCGCSQRIQSLSKWRLLDQKSQPLWNIIVAVSVAVGSQQSGTC